VTAISLSETPKLIGLILCGLILLFVSTIPQVFADPQHCYSHGDCYNLGYGHGYTDLRNGYSSVDACHNHSQAYCDGYHQGYGDAISNNPNTGFQQDQSSQVNIHGNNNDVNINQAQSVQSGNGGDGGNSYHGANPRCLLICATVNH
jgi:hypothetical protein